MSIIGKCKNKYINQDNEKGNDGDGKPNDRSQYDIMYLTCLVVSLIFYNFFIVIIHSISYVEIRSDKGNVPQNYNQEQNTIWGIEHDSLFV
jgi:hypothetical protein